MLSEAEPVGRASYPDARRWLVVRAVVADSLIRAVSDERVAAWSPQSAPEGEAPAEASRPGCPDSFRSGGVNPPTRPWLRSKKGYPTGLWRPRASSQTRMPPRPPGSRSSCQPRRGPVPAVPAAPRRASPFPFASFRPRVSTMIKASCHCGAVIIQVAARPERLTSCNCSICRRLGSLMAYYRPDDVVIRCAPDATVPYVFPLVLVDVPGMSNGRAA
jgi:hypothetical protein